MWAFAIEYYNGRPYSPCGNDGAMKLRNKTPRGWKNETEYFGRKGAKIYILPDYTQEMCELEPYEFAEYIMKYGYFLKMR